MRVSVASVTGVSSVAFIGFGEAAQAFSGAPTWRGVAQTFDLKVLDASSRLEIERAGERAGVAVCASVGDACSSALLIISVVTADQALHAAGAAAPFLEPGAIFCDFNSVAPDTKRLAAKVIEAIGGRYVDVAVMAPVLPARLDVPLLVAGPHAQAAVEALESCGFGHVRNLGDEVGSASAIKMIRSVMVKGIEALTAECFLAAEAAGVRAEVAASLNASWPGVDWSKNADYNLDRMMVHGLRRAEEVEEVVKTLDALGTGSFMSRGTVDRHRAIGQLRISPPEGLLAKLAVLLSSGSIPNHQSQDASRQ